MAAPGWRTSWIVLGFDPRTRFAVPVVVGLIAAANGGVLLALRIGDDDRVVMLPPLAAAQLIVHLQTAIAEMLEITGEKIGASS